MKINEGLIFIVFRNNGSLRKSVSDNPGVKLERAIYKFCEKVAEAIKAENVVVGDGQNAVVRKV